MASNVIADHSGSRRIERPGQPFARVHAIGTWQDRAPLLAIIEVKDFISLNDEWQLFDAMALPFEVPTSTIDSKLVKKAAASPAISS